MKRIIFLICLSINLLSFSYDVLIDYKNYDKINLNRETLLVKDYSPSFDNFIYAKANSNIRKEPNINSKVVAKLIGGMKVEVLKLVQANDKSTWFMVNKNGIVGYLSSDLALKREFNFEKAINYAIKINDFIRHNKWRIKIISKFNPLDNSVLNEDDDLGNSANQSVTVYKGRDKKGHFNLPDRSILSVIDEDENFFTIYSPFYDSVLYLKKEDEKYLKNSGIGREANKFIFIDKKSQTQLSLELKNDKFNLITNSYVTTGQSSKYGFETPSGLFLVAVTKRKMFYLKDGTTDKINGEANYAIRFSGGAYLHGIPSLYEPKETIQSRIEQTRKLLGSYAISHKCVRNYDEVVSTLYDWIGYKKITDGNIRIPKENTFVIVE